MRKLKLRAIEENRTLTGLLAEVLRRGLAKESAEPGAFRNRVTLPLVHVAHAARPDKDMTPDRVSEILLAQEIDAHHDLVLLAPWDG